METWAATFGAILKRRRRRRLYQRLNGRRRVRAGGRWRYRKITVPKLRPKAMLPINFLRRFRDAYVRMMLCFAGRLTYLNNGDHFSFQRKIPNPMASSGRLWRSKQAGYTGLVLWIRSLRDMS